MRMPAKRKSSKRSSSYLIPRILVGVKEGNNDKSRFKGF